MNNQQETRVSFPHPTKITTTNILEHLHNYQFPISRQIHFKLQDSLKYLRTTMNYSEIPILRLNIQIKYSFFGLMTNDHKNGIGIPFKKGKSIYEGVWQENQKYG